MDPQQTAVYAKAHSDLQDLFREIACHGRVSAHELQHSVLPFAAGDARRDLQELIDDMKRKQTSLDEADFIRVLWKKMYLNNVMYTAQHTGVAHQRRPASAGASPSLNHNDPEPAVNIPIAHVIVSIKRRAQLKQFANYYASRGISGADHLKADAGAKQNENRTPRHILRAQKQRLAMAAAAAQSASIVSLRDRNRATLGVVVCCYDSDVLALKSYRLYASLHDLHINICSRLHCSLSSKETGPMIITSRFFKDLVRSQATKLQGSVSDGPEEVASEDDDNEDGSEGESHESIATNSLGMQGPALQSISMTRLDSLGLRHTVALGVGRGIVTVATQRRIHSWDAFTSRSTSTGESTPVAIAGSAARSQQAVPTAPTAPRPTTTVSRDVLEYLEDQGDSFGHTPLLKRTKSVGDVPGIRQIACGDRFAVGITAASEVFVWGQHILGRNKSTPSKLNSPARPLGLDSIDIRHVACGLHHVVLLTSTGSILTWGSNVHGQLGLGAEGSLLDPILLEPTRVALPGVILDAACGDHHTVALNDKGAVFAWGNNWHGQLGLDPATSESGCVPSPTRVNWWLNSDITADDDSASDEARVDSSSRESLSSHKAYLIAAVGDTTAIVTDQGHVYTWGKCIPSGTHSGVCGIVDKWQPQRVTALDELLQSEGGDSFEVSGSDAALRNAMLPPWTSIAIANGIFLLTIVNPS